MKFLKIFQETAKNTSYLLMFQDGAEAWKIIFFYGWVMFSLVIIVIVVL